MTDYFKESIKLHKENRGKLETKSKIEIKDKDDLSIVYSPGVGAPSEEIYKDKEKVYELTNKGNMVAVVSDGSSVLGLGNIGPYAAIPVMEGKSLLFKAFANIDAFPITLNTQDPDEIIETVKRIEPVFGGINLEDISAPRCFYIEEQLQDIGIPVFHDDQHGTAIVLLSALINAVKVVGKKLEDINVVVNGAGAAGVAIAKLLRCINTNSHTCIAVNDIIVCDSKGIISRSRNDLSEVKKMMLEYTNKDNKEGLLKDALIEADVFIGVSKGNLLQAEDIETMSKDAIIFALANPVPEIMPDEAYKGGAAIVGTGRSDLPNQINNVLAFPGIFRGALDSRASQITPKMKLAAVDAIASLTPNPTKENIIISTLDDSVVKAVSKAVSEARDNKG